MILNSNLKESLKAEGYKIFIESYEKEPEIFSQYATVKPTTLAYEKETVVTGGGRLRKKPYGGEYYTGEMKEAYTPIIKVDEFGELLGAEGATIEDVEHKLGNLLRKKMPIYAEQCRHSKEYEVADLLSYGGYTSGYHDVFDNSADDGSWTDVSGDGVYTGTAASPKPLFTLSGNDWTAPNGDTYFNAFSDKALSYNGLVDMCKKMADDNSYNESGDKVVLMPDTLIVGTYDQLLTARRILESDKLAGTANNDKNVMKQKLNPIWNPFLTDAAKTAGAFAVGVAKKGLVLYTRIEPEFEFFEDKKANIFYIRVRVRFGAGVVNVRYWVGNKFPTS